ncbi:hypothetical protein C0995_006063, partial [Termitomyces sp. Mi166
KKDYAVRYLTYNTGETWMSVKEYEGEFTPAATHNESEPAACAYTYEEWKVEIFKLYSGSESRDRYTQNNLKKLIADFLSKGTPLQALFLQYHREFQKIVKWLADNSKMERSSEKEKFQRGIPSTLWVRIVQCLEILYLLHHPDDPYEVEEMFNTGDWYLKGNTTAMASIPPTGHQGGILPAPSPQPATAPVNAKTTNTSGSDSGDSLAQALERLTKPSGANTGQPLLPKDLCHFCKQIGHTMVKGRCLELENYIGAGKCRKNRDNKVVLLSGGYILQYPEKLYYKDRLEEWHYLNSGNLATENLSTNAAPDAQQQQAINNMQVPAAATLVHEIVQEPRVDQYVLTTDERIEYHQQELLKLQMLRCSNKRQVADGVQILLPKQPLTNYHPVDTPKSPPNANAELPPKDKGKKLMKPTVEEVPEEALPLIHPYSGIPEIQITEPMPKNVTTASQQQDGAYKTLALAAMKEQEWTIKAFNTIWDHNITMTVGGALAISQSLRNHF